MPLCGSMSWCGGSSSDDVVALPKPPPAKKFWRIAIGHKNDMEKVDDKLRQLYGTMDGQPCQALLTTEYVHWKHTVLQNLSNLHGDFESRSLHANCMLANGPRCRFPSQVPEDRHDVAACPRPLIVAIEAFLPNYHLLYVQGSVDINPHEPLVRVETRTKRGFQDLQEHVL